MRTKWTMVMLASALAALSGTSCPDPCGETEPNPAVDRIDFNLVSTTSSTAGTVQILGVVENKGGGTFDSGPGQQSVQLYEGDTLVAQQSFEDLAPGAQAAVSYTRSWSTATEFPPNYRVLIAYDPDIYIDGNPNNDDCNTVDNTMTRSGSEINSVFP